MPGNTQIGHGIWSITNLVKPLKKSPVQRIQNLVWLLWSLLLGDFNVFYFFFFTKIHSFKLIKYITSDTNIVKNVKDEFAKKFTTSKLIAYNDKMPINNMIESTLQKFPCF